VEAVVGMEKSTKPEIRLQPNTPRLLLQKFTEALVSAIS